MGLGRLQSLFLEVFESRYQILEAVVYRCCLRRGHAERDRSVRMESEAVSRPLKLLEEGIRKVSFVQIEVGFIRRPQAFSLGFERSRGVRVRLERQARWQFRLRVP